LPAQTPKKLIINAQAFIGGSQNAQDVEIWINGAPQVRVTLGKRFGNKVEVPLPATVLNSEKLKVDFVFLTAVSPKALGIGIDERPLAIGLEAVTYE
jgi:hypothetical protein